MAEITPINPTQRINAEILKSIQERMKALKADELQQFWLIYTTKDQGVCLEAFGLDWALLGLTRAYLDDLSAKLLKEDGPDEYDLG